MDQSDAARGMVAAVFIVPVVGLAVLLWIVARIVKDRRGR